MEKAPQRKEKIETSVLAYENGELGGRDAVDKPKSTVFP